MRISLVIPARNERANLEELLPRARAYGDEHLLVDGQSSDGSAEVARAHGFAVIQDHGRGKGDALRTAIAAVSGDVIVFMDADQSHDPDDIPRLVQPILDGSADQVVGSRMRGGSDELHGTVGELVRLWGSTLITLGINLRYGAHLTDSQNGFRALRTTAARALVLTEDITTIEQEMIVAALRLGQRVAEVPTHEYRRKHGQPTFQVQKVALRYVVSLVKLLR